MFPKGAAILAERISCVLWWVSWKWLCPGQPPCCQNLVTCTQYTIKGNNVPISVFNNSLNLVNESCCLSTSLFIHGWQKFLKYIPHYIDW